MFAAKKNKEKDFAYSVENEPTQCSCLVWISLQLGRCCNMVFCN